ncbi:hypothetical protein SPRG_02186 [Saprolegnia parasitica CBS 223.65]|uniref:Uncharacterized protein n=1 Tax=Saprolegnia parasitica (strain CBS 223.65) TaxID=695850 RepID=A0A067CRP2_SAPPC|nr:hypothetical protein SPRG_02186 [Saprolegnia parasitica CBS 223.65]KDO33379.1 hypothetical protein SPRG_02186 [Saprolegnia parasitica CBS 223.65]|eukprot:XP_012196127.1 hypothetical protein SPRG_02186 [Saprolegnia parasitica CBS 223.65]
MPESSTLALAERRRLRKCESTQRWRSKKSVAALEARVAELRLEHPGNLHALRYDALLQTKNELLRHNRALREAIERRSALPHIIARSMAASRLEVTRILHDDFFVLGQVQAAMRLVAVQVPSAFTSPTSETILLQRGGWALHGPSTDDTIQAIGARFWAMRNREDLYLQLHANAASFQVLRELRDGLSVARTMPKSVMAPRFLIQSLVHVRDGFDHTLVFLSPDLDRITAAVELQYRLQSGRLVAQVHAVQQNANKDIGIDTASALHLLTYVAGELSEMERLIRLVT